MADAGSSKDCSCLCGLVGRCLRQFSDVFDSDRQLDEPLFSSQPRESVGTPLYALNDAEKNLLVSLTMVLRKIRSCTTEIESNDVHENAPCSIFCGNCSCHMEGPLGCESCAANVTLLLVAFLSGSNQYVRHLAIKVLAAISNFLLQYVSMWKEFICFLWTSLKVAMNSCTSAGPIDLNLASCLCTSEASTSMNGSADHAHFAAILQKRLTNLNWFMHTSLTQALHIIHKSLKKDDSSLLESFVHCAIFSLLKMPWSQWSKMYAAQSVYTEVGEFCEMETNGVFPGAVLQLLCSLVEQNKLEVGNNPLEESSVYFKFISIVSEILVGCFSNRAKYSLSMYQYLRHKGLVLMFRLSFWSHWRCSSLVSWVELLRRYFKDILDQSIIVCDPGHNVSLLGSPFLSIFAEGGKVENLCTTHLQRRAILLFLKSCFTLIPFGDKVLPCHMCQSITSLQCELPKHGECCFFDALSEIYCWLQTHLPLDNYADDTSYIHLCRKFSLSFLKLYMDEDDLLFEMLLLLFDTPFATMQGRQDGNVTENLGRDDISFHMSNIFSPIGFFHLFLLLIHYDHLVLLDYLISRDIGVLFLEYLLRCMRLVCNSWSSFVEFSVCPNEIGQSGSKRRKLCENEKHFFKMRDHTCFITDECTDDYSVLETGDDKMNEPGSSSQAMTKTMFLDAKGCLLSLKTSVEDLHRKNLFPYSPAPLLRSFARFQELSKAEQ